MNCIQAIETGPTKREIDGLTEDEASSQGNALSDRLLDQLLGNSPNDQAGIEITSPEIRTELENLLKVLLPLIRHFEKSEESLSVTGLRYVAADIEWAIADYDSQ